MSKTGWGRVLRLGQTWEVAAWEIAHLECCHLGRYPLEVAFWENPLGNYLTPIFFSLKVKTCILFFCLHSLLIILTLYPVFFTLQVITGILFIIYFLYSEYTPCILYSFSTSYNLYPVYYLLSVFRI